MNKQFTYDHIFGDKKKVLLVVAHPDDSLVYFGGLLAKLQRDEKEVTVVVVTNGGRGSRENKISEEKLADIRKNEEQEALSFVGIKPENIYNLNYLDGEVNSDYELIGKIAKYLRKTKADIVCTHEPSLIYQETYDKRGYFVQHRDHREVGEATIDAAYPFSRDRSFFIDQYSEGIEPHTTFDILLTDEAGSNFDFDYTEVLENKKSAMRSYKSQFDENTINDIVDAVKFGDRYLEKFKYLHLLW